MSGAKKMVKPRFWLILITLFALSMIWMYSSQAGFIDRQDQAISDLMLEKRQLADQNAELQRKIDFTETDEYIIREAREKLGLFHENDILFESNDAPKR